MVRAHKIDLHERDARFSLFSPGGKKKIPPDLCIRAAAASVNASSNLNEGFNIKINADMNTGWCSMLKKGQNQPRDYFKHVMEKSTDNLWDHFARHSSIHRYYKGGSHILRASNVDQIKKKKV